MLKRTSSVIIRFPFGLFVVVDIPRNCRPPPARGTAPVLSAATAGPPTVTGAAVQHRSPAAVEGGAANSWWWWRWWR